MTDQRTKEWALIRSFSNDQFELETRWEDRIRTLPTSQIRRFIEGLDELTPMNCWYAEYHVVVVARHLAKIVLFQREQAKERAAT